jgi:predicted AlkP superfamily pyrophosphatase or phosphodiesterase
LYNIPFKYIHLFDFTEKKSPLQPGGMNRGPNIFDFLVEHKIPYFVTDTRKTEEQNRDDIVAAIESESVDFVFQYWAGLDGLLHSVGNKSPEVPAKLRVYEQWIETILASAKKHYGEVRLYIFSDHGMANCDELVDLKAKIDALPVRMEKDYAVVYDSTMARFWFFNDRARELVAGALATVPEGRVMPDEELRRYNAFFEDRHFGELIFLMREGVLIVPSHMGERPIRAMHGYHPTDPQSYATLCSNQPAIPGEVTHIPHICRIMEKTALLAKDRNAAK